MCGNTATDTVVISSEFKTRLASILQQHAIPSGLHRCDHYLFFNQAVTKNTTQSV